MRYLPLSDADRREMLDVIGAKSIDDLFGKQFLQQPSERLRRVAVRFQHSQHRHGICAG